MQVRPQSCLAARYVQFERSRILQHLEAAGYLTLGRIKRQAGEALCDRRLQLIDDSAAWPDASTSRCARCWALAIRHRLSIAAPPNSRRR
jgi:hypothetical protein